MVLGVSGEKVYRGGEEVQGRLKLHELLLELSKVAHVSAPIVEFPLNLQ